MTFKAWYMTNTQNLLKQLIKTSHDYSKEDWDSYGAFPVSKKSIANSADFIMSMPDNIPAPEISVEPDGLVCFDWAKSKSSRFSISIGEKNSIYYAWINCGNRGYNTVCWDKENIPQEIISNLNSFLK